MNINICSFLYNIGSTNFSVFDAGMFRVLKAAGCNPQIIGKPQRIGGVMSYASLFEGSAESISRRARHREVGSCSGREGARVRPRELLLAVA